MSIAINTQFTIHSPGPIDTRTQVSTYAGLALIPVKYVGLKVYVGDEDKEYRYYSNGWQVWAVKGGSVTGSASWGSITGLIADQTDLMNQLNLKFNKSGGVITGYTTVLSEVESYNFILAGSSASAEISPFAKLVTVPQLANDPGIRGEYAVDAQFAYFCIADNTWVKVVVNTWV